MTKELKDVVDGFCDLQEKSKAFGIVYCGQCGEDVTPANMVFGMIGGKQYNSPNEALEDVGQLRKVISDALRAATTGRHVDRAIRASMILEDGLKTNSRR